MPEPTLLPSMRALRTFESAARLGSFSAAAEEVHTTQSSVSRAISDLERRLGARLFERLHRGGRAVPRCGRDRPRANRRDGRGAGGVGDVYLVEDAVAGEGLALGRRRFIDRHLETGTLVAAREGFVAFDRPHFARLTERGRHRPLARRCLDFFDELSRRAEEL